MFKNWKITTRLIATLSLLGAVILGIAAIAIVKMVSMVDSTREITTNWLPSIEAVSAVDGTFSDFRVSQYAHVLNTDSAAMAHIEKELSDIKAAFETQRAAYAKLISSDEERKLYDSFSADWATYLQLHEKMIELSRRNETDAARTILEKEIDPLFDRASETVQKLVKLNHDGSVAANEAAEASYESARASMILVVLGALSVAAVAGVWLVRSIGGPLRAAVSAADRVAAGDFSVAIEADGNDEAALVLKALSRMQAGLSDVVYSVRSNSESVATASAQIAQGNQDLSQRTEEQASALEETAATMEELGSTVRSNADNARQANQLAQAASGAATQGGEMVLQVVSTMQGISESSRKIGDIIGVIDGIAFQTNILALNAAVEAARAGEQGRGFAVVAGEVRTLAQRSAEAAKEIRALISRNVEQVEQGTSLVDRAGKSMEDIVGSIRKVTDIVGEISSAATEQSSGIQQVGEAVGQMDQVTQQNAALVEESAAAAESLKTQAEQLVQAVSVFKLSGGLRAGGAAPAVAVSHTPVHKPVARPAPAARPATAAASPARPAVRKEVAAPVVAAPAAAAAESDEWATF